jgi:hypothetical protein
VIRISKLNTEAIHSYWYDPRTGEVTLIETIEEMSDRRFTPPSSGRGNDWILVLDDASRNFRLPAELQ